MGYASGTTVSLDWGMTQSRLEGRIEALLDFKKRFPDCTSAFLRRESNTTLEYIENAKAEVYAPPLYVKLKETGVVEEEDIVKSQERRKYNLKFH
jgi:hypothetical protein